LPDPTRVDPPSRPVDGSILTAVKLVNADPGRQYIRANPNDEWTGVPAMKQLGYEVERHRKDGPRYVGGARANDGDLVIAHGLVLMSRPVEMQRAAEEHTRHVARTRAMAMGQPGGVDSVTGDGGKPATVSIRH
jgi:hypothetical protein